MKLRVMFNYDPYSARFWKGIKVENILIFRTSADATIHKLIDELKKNRDREIDCLIQSSQLQRYKADYPYINFIDIRGERFENLPLDVIELICSKRYNNLYITLTGEKAYNFWNVIEIVNKVRFKRGFFYNCNGQKIEIPGKNILKDTICRLYIRQSKFF